MSRKNGDPPAGDDQLAALFREAFAAPDDPPASDAATAETLAQSPSRKRRIPKSSLWKRADGWHFRYDAGLNAQGKRHRPTVVFGQLRDRAAAERAAVKFLEARKRVKRGAASLAFGAFAAAYVEHCVPRLNDDTRAATASVIACHIEPRFAGLLLHAVKDHVQAWIDAQAAEDPPVPLSTIRYRFRILRAMLSEAVRRTLITVEHLPPRPIWPRGRQLKRTREEITFTTAEQRRLLDCSPWPLRAALALGFLVGLRPGEIVGLEWPLVDLMTGRLTIRQQAQHGAVMPLKTDSSAAVIQMPPELIAILGAYYRHVRRAALTSGRAPRFLFENDDGTPLRTSRLRTRHLYPLEDQLALPRRGLHACRRSFADRLLAAETPIDRIQAALRHDTLAATQRYLSEAQPADVADAIARAARLAMAAKLDEGDINRPTADVIAFPDDD